MCSAEDVYLKVIKEALPDHQLVKEVICLDALEDAPHSWKGAVKWAEKEIDEMGLEGGAGANGVVELSKDNLANLIYTSGTTEKPKLRLKSWHLC
ncbi:hypothetical protein ACHAWF_010809 [Thalassiosira exigua]